MKKSLLGLTFFISILIIISTAFNSCGNYIVNNNYNTTFDSSRYDWEIDTIRGEYMWDGWFYDTNNIFLLGYTLIKYDGHQFTQSYFNGAFGPHCISGLDNNNVYVGGLHLTSGNTYRAMIQKWAGGVFTNYTITDPADTANAFSMIYAKNHNEIWLYAYPRYVYKFDGNNFQRYSFGSWYTFTDRFMVDLADNIYFLGYTYYGSQSVDSSIIELNKFENSSWRKIYSRILYKGETYFHTQNIGYEIYALADQTILKFTGNNFTPIMNISLFLLLNAKVCGPSMQSLSCIGYDYASRNDYLFNWNDIHWSKELYFKDGLNVRILHSDNQRIYAVYYDFNLNNSYLIIGRRKK